MFPSFEFLGKEISLYFIFATAAFLLCGVIYCHYINKAGKDDNEAIVFLLIVCIGIFIGGHILYGITNIKHFGRVFGAVTGFKSFIEAIGTIFGGQVFYGGLIGGAIIGYIYLRIKKYDIPLYTDLMGFTIPLFHGFARIGCFFGGCCYGIESSFGFITHTNHLVPTINGVRRFPVQLLEALCCFILFAVILYLYRKGKLKGRLLFTYLILYGVVRFFDEFLRGDEYRGFVGVLSTSQFISILIEIFAITGFIYVTRKIKAGKIDFNGQAEELKQAEETK